MPRSHAHARWRNHMVRLRFGPEFELLAKAIALGWIVGSAWGLVF
jgi:hypothetical protein